MKGIFRNLYKWASLAGMNENYSAFIKEVLDKDIDEREKIKEIHEYIEKQCSHSYRQGLKDKEEELEKAPIIPSAQEEYMDNSVSSFLSDEELENIGLDFEDDNCGSLFDDCEPQVPKCKPPQMPQCKPPKEEPCSSPIARDQAHLDRIVRKYGDGEYLSVTWRSPGSNKSDVKIEGREGIREIRIEVGSEAEEDYVE